MVLADLLTPMKQIGLFAALLWISACGFVTNPTTPSDPTSTTTNAVVYSAIGASDASGITDQRKGTKHEKVNCEACHGPLATHASSDVMHPGKPDLKTVCTPCHKKMDGRPKSQPQVDFAEHSGDALCTDCHKPHSPKIQQ